MNREFFLRIFYNYLDIHSFNGTTIALIEQWMNMCSYSWEYRARVLILWSCLLEGSRNVKIHHIEYRIKFLEKYIQDQFQIDPLYENSSVLYTSQSRIQNSKNQRIKCLQLMSLSALQSLEIDVHCSSRWHHSSSLAVPERSDFQSCRRRSSWQIQTNESNGKRRQQEHYYYFPIILNSSE